MSGGQVKAVHHLIHRLRQGSLGWYDEGMNKICDLDPTPINARGEFDDRPLEMMSKSELRGYIVQIRERYSRVIKANRPADAEGLRIMHRELAAEWRRRFVN